MSTSQDPTQDPMEEAGQVPDQDAEPPGDGIPGQVHPDDPAEGPDTGAENPA